MRTTPPSLSEMKLLEKCAIRIFKGKDEPLEFKYCIAVFTDGHTIFRAQTSYTLLEIETHLDELEGVALPRELFCPNVGKEQFINVTSPMPDTCYVKTPSLLHFSEEDRGRICGLVLSEARACQALMKNPHPNVAQYYGCKQDGPLITGLCFERYHEDLYNTVMDKGMSGLSIDKIVQGIRNGIEHIHSLGYCHNDISPNNIMLRPDGNPVIIDFDSCKPTNMELDKSGTPGFEDASVKVSKPERDFYGLKKIEECLLRGDFCI